MTNALRWRLLNCAAAIVMMPTAAYAQNADTPAQAADMPSQTAPAAKSVDEDAGQIVVTGSRIRQDGYNAPVPVTVLGSQEIQAQKPNNIADLVNTLPAVTGGTFTAANSSGNISSGTAGLASVNLRGLGAGRTLILIDGRRTPPSTFTGIVDLNTIPQDLVRRVEVVTGGASAQYGSDAVVT